MLLLMAKHGGSCEPVSIVARTKPQKRRLMTHTRKAPTSNIATTKTSPYGSIYVHIEQQTGFYGVCNSNEDGRGQI